MATPSTPSCSSNPVLGTPPASQGKFVLLYDWWLIETESDCDGNRLGVGGSMSSGGLQATRVFSSTPIIKRYDAFTLETSDGITVLTQGPINKACTIDAGVPLEVCNRFLNGFPNDWNHYADEYFGNKSISTSIPTNVSVVKEAFKHSSNTADGKLLNQLDKFLLRRLPNALTSTYTNLSKKFSGIMRYICDNSLMKASDLSSIRESLPEDSLNENELDKGIQTHVTGYSCTINPGAEDVAVAHEEEASSHESDLNVKKFCNQ